MVKHEPAAIVQEAEALKACDRAQQLCLERNLSRARADLHNYDLGMLLREIKHGRWAEKLHSIPFEAWVKNSLTDRSGAPMRLHNAEKLMEQAMALEPWPVIREYHRKQTESPDAEGCIAPREPGRVPCVTWWSVCEALRWARIDRRLEDDLAERVAAWTEDRGQEPGIQTTNSLLDEAKQAVSRETLVLAHEKVADIRARILEAQERRGWVQPDPLKRLSLVLDPNVLESWQEAMAFVLKLEGFKTPEDQANLSDSQRVERMAGFVLDIKDRMSQKGK